jgi:type I restriction enzyme S subunit
MINGLPQGWAPAALGDLFDFKYGKGLPRERRNDKGSVSVYGSNGVVGVHNVALTGGPTIIVGRKGSVGEVHVSPEACWPIDTTYFIDEFPANLPPPYWALYLKSLRLGHQEKSSAIPGISREDIYAVDISVPPLAEQRRIVAKLEKLLGKVDASQQRLAKIPILLKRFRQSVLAAACSGRLTADWRETKGTTLGEWELVSVRDVSEKIQYGYTASAKLSGNGPRFLRITDIQDGRVAWDQVPTCDIPSSVEPKYALKSRDIVFARTGATTGKSFLIRSCPSSVFASYLIRVRANPKV